MMWVFKSDNGTYLHDFKVGLYGRIEEPRWIPSQMFAWRFHDRNAASVVSMKLNVAGRIKSLTPGGFNKRLTAIEARNREVRKDLTVALELLRTGLLPSEGQKP